MIEYREHNGKVFQLHWKYRFGPLVMLAGAGVQAYGQYQAGKAAAAQGKQEQMIMEKVLAFMKLKQLIINI